MILVKWGSTTNQKLCPAFGKWYTSRALGCKLKFYEEMHILRDKEEHGTFLAKLHRNSCQPSFITSYQMCH